MSFKEFLKGAAELAVEGAKAVKETIDKRMERIEKLKERYRNMEDDRLLSLYERSRPGDDKIALAMVLKERGIMPSREREEN